MTALSTQRTPGLWKPFRTLRAAVAANVVIWKGANGEMQIRRDAIPEMREDLKQIIEEMK